MKNKSPDHESSVNQPNLDNVENTPAFKRRFARLKEWYQERHLMMSDNPSHDEVMKNYHGQIFDNIYYKNGGSDEVSDDELQFFVEAEIRIVEEQVKRGMGLPADDTYERDLGYGIRIPTVISDHIVGSNENSQFLNSIRQDIPPEELKELAEKAGVDYEEFISQGKKTGEILETSKPSDVINPRTGEVERVPEGRFYLETDRTKYYAPIAIVPKIPALFERPASRDRVALKDQLFDDYLHLEQQPPKPSDLEEKPYLPALLNFPTRLRFDY